MSAVSAEQFRTQPTVIGAVRRYSTLVLLTAVMAAVAGVGYSLLEPEEYRATATVTVPPLLSEGDSTDQDLDSQVVLLQSRGVAEEALRIAHRTPGGSGLRLGDLYGPQKTLEVTPPEGTTPGIYGATIITVSFTGPSGRGAQVAANAVLRSFEKLRTSTIAEQARATITGIDKAIEEADSAGQRRHLMSERTQALVAQRKDLAREPTVAWAERPEEPVNGNAKMLGGVGLMMGAVGGAGVAFALESRRKGFRGPRDAEGFYAAPVLGHIPRSQPPVNEAFPDPSRGVLLMATDPGSPAAEAFRFTAGSLERTYPERAGCASLAFVSARRSPLRSAVVANLAVAVAEGGASVLAVDADGQDGRLTAVLTWGRRTAGGFRQLLLGRSAATACIVPSWVRDDVCVLPAGHRPSARITGPAYAKAARQALAEVKSTSDLVLVDCPPVLGSAEATELVDAVDAVVVVVGADDPVEDHAALLERLSLTTTDIVGLVYCAPSAALDLAGLLRRLRSLRPPAGDRAGSWKADPSPALRAVPTDEDALPTVSKRR